MYLAVHELYLTVHREKFDHWYQRAVYRQVHKLYPAVHTRIFDPLMRGVVYLAAHELYLGNIRPDRVLPRRERRGAPALGGAA